MKLQHFWSTKSNIHQSTLTINFLHSQLNFFRDIYLTFDSSKPSKALVLSLNIYLFCILKSVYKPIMSALKAFVYLFFTVLHQTTLLYLWIRDFEENSKTSNYTLRKVFFELRSIFNGVIEIRSDFCGFGLIVGR